MPDDSMNKSLLAIIAIVTVGTVSVFVVSPHFIETTAFLIFFINSVSIREFHYQFGDMIINSVSIRRHDLSIRQKIPRVSESLINDVYQFGINSEIFSKPFRNCRKIVDRIFDRV